MKFNLLFLSFFASILTAEHIPTVENQEPKHSHTVSDTTPKNDCTSQWREIDYRVAPFPDTSARYLSYQFRIPKGKKVALKFEGEFPVARYMSYHVYDQVTEDSLSSVYDAQIAADMNSKNPYLPGVDRYSTNRNYTVWASCADTKLSKEHAGALKLPCHSEKDELVDIWYRVYINEGELVFPKVTAYNAETGAVLDCPPKHLKNDSIATEFNVISGMREPAKFLNGRVPAPFKNGEVHFYHPSSRSLGANDQNKYLSTRLDGKGIEKPGTARGIAEDILLKLKGVEHGIGDVTVLKFKLPTFPDTEKKLKSFSGQEEVRFWSICVSGEKTDASNCLRDSQFQRVKGEDGEEYAVLVIGPNEPGFREQVESRGFNYLHHSAHRAPFLFYRQMLARSDFTGRIENVTPISQADFNVEGVDPRVAQVEPARVKDFFGDSKIGGFSPMGRQCKKSEDFFESYCGLKGIKQLEKKK